MANVGYESGGRSSTPWCRCCIDCLHACSSFLSCICGCELSWRDIVRLLPCVIWVAVALLASVLHIVIALCKNKFPETMPIFWGWLSALPAFMCAVLIVMYHRDALHEKGFTKDAAVNMGLLYGFLTTVGVLVYLTFAIASLVFIFRCSPETPAVKSTLDHCNTGNFGHNAFCFLMAVAWLVLQSCLTPRPRYVQELILKHEHAQAGLNLGVVARPPPGQTGGGAAGAPGGSGGDAGAAGAAIANANVHPTLYGNPAMYETAIVYTGQPTAFTGPSTYAKTVNASGGGGRGAQK